MGKNREGKQKNYLVNTTENTALILITLGARRSLKVALKRKGMLEFPQNPSSDSSEELF